MNLENEPQSLERSDIAGTGVRTPPTPAPTYPEIIEDGFQSQSTSRTPRPNNQTERTTPVEHGNLPFSSSEPQGFFGDSSTFRLLSKIPPAQGGFVRTEQRRSSSHWSEPNEPPTESAISSYKFPSRGFADQLVDAYFERVHIFYPFIHEGAFRAEYEMMWSTEEHMRRETDTSRIAILNMVFAYGCEFCQTVPSQDIFDEASPFVARARKIVMSLVFKDTDLPLVQAMLLLSSYLQGTLALNECWNLVGLTIRSAVSIGMHLSPGEDRSLTAVDREMRKRIWWGCFILDRTLSMKYGRPPSINVDDAVAVEFPAEVDDQYITQTPLTPRQPSNRPSRTTFFVQTIHMAFVIDKILTDMYLGSRKSHLHSSAGHSHLRNTRETALLGRTIYLDGNLQAWWNDMPHHLRAEPEHFDGPEFQRQRCVIRLRSRILIYFSRPVLTDLGISTCDSCCFVRPSCTSVAMTSKTTSSKPSPSPPLGHA